MMFKGRILRLPLFNISDKEFYRRMLIFENLSIAYLIILHWLLSMGILRP